MWKTFGNDGHSHDSDLFQSLWTVAGDHRDFYEIPLWGPDVGLLGAERTYLLKLAIEPVS